MENTPHPEPQSHIAAEIPEVNETNFGEEVLASALPVWVVFEACWSTPCQMMDEFLSDVSDLCGEVARVVSVDADANPGLGLWYEVAHLPTLLLFAKGEVCARIVGISDKLDMLTKIKKAMK